MAQSAPFILKLLACSASAAARAGAIIRDVMTKGDLGIVEKGSGHNDLQTEADRSAQRCIAANLLKMFPDVTIIGEEGCCDAKDEVPPDWIVSHQLNSCILTKICPPELEKVDPKDVVVWVDPLDGTHEYTQGLLDHITVLIGIAIKGKPVGGVIHQPYHDYKLKKECSGRTIWGLVGQGVGGFTPQDPPKDKFIITTTRAHSDETVVKALEALKADEVIRVGGAGHKALMLLEGKAHAYVFASKGTKKWDTCAPEAVLRALGGTLTDIHGHEYDYSKDVCFPNAQGILATCKCVDHNELIKKIPQELKDKFPPQ